MPNKGQTTGSGRQAPEAVLNAFAKKLKTSRVLRKGTIVFRLTGTNGGEYCVDCSEKGIHVVEGQPQVTPRLEVMGDSQRILAIIQGKKNPISQFLAGGLRVRGDLRYLSDLAMEMGILNEPL